MYVSISVSIARAHKPTHSHTEMNLIENNRQKYKFGYDDATKSYLYLRLEKKRQNGEL